MNARARTEGPRERLARLGADPLSDAELVAILLGTGTEGIPVPEVAASLLHHAGGLRGLVALSARELAEFPGVGPSKAARLLAAAELGLRAVGRPRERGAQLSSSEAVHAAYRARFLGVTVEEVLVVAVDARHRVLSERLVARGGLTACSVTPRDVFAPLIREAAPAFVLLHNHPSGDPAPSPEDGRWTEQMADLGERLGLRLLDHVIVADTGYFSFRDAGRLPPQEKTAKSRPFPPRISPTAP